MTQRPEYVDLLNDIRLQEVGAGVYLKAWADRTTDPDLKHCLDVVTAREAIHGDVFSQRMIELGYEPQGAEDEDYAPRLEMLSSNLSDAEKIKALMDHVEAKPKPSPRERAQVAVDDESVDSLTRSLLRWWNDVEDDTGTLIEKAFDSVKAAG